jgi:PAP2 superfamily
MRLKNSGCAAGLAALIAAVPPARADGIQTAGEVLRVALPVAAGGYSLYREDYDGVLQLGVSEVFAVGSSYVLQQLIREERPDKSDMRSFPSDSAAMAFSAASFLQIRYGWEYGAPAYAVATFVGYSRVQADKHHWHDVVVGAILGWAASSLTTIEYQNVRIMAAPGFRETPLGLSLTANW